MSTELPDAPAYQGAQFAASRDEAEQRWNSCKFEDPFPSIRPALLSANAILNYSRVTAMIYPFRAQNLKAASYQVGMGGMLIRWDGDQKFERRVADLDQITLPANSITFVETEEEFFLPHYIAIRFNLKITHVHRGLLLGTGPLVDPGFSGRLLIPLHNLTSSDYTVPKTNDLIWVEFTKTSFVEQPKEENFDRRHDHKHLFPSRKQELGPNDYLYKAGLGEPIASSIPQAIRESAASAEAAAKNSDTSRQQAENVSKDFSRFRNWAVIGAVFAVLSVAVTVLAIYFQAVAIVQDAVTLVRSK